jgi:hypothetical protein
MFLCADPEELVAFWGEGLGFRVSDRTGGITWMRCDADHHGLAVGGRPEGTSCTTMRGRSRTGRRSASTATTSPSAA